MLAPRKRLVHVLSVIFLIVVLFLYHRDSDIIYFRWASALEALPDKPPANRTLGFGAVLVVSKEGSERRHSLLQAANVTDISLITPAQPKWTDNDVEQFRNGQEQGVQRGSILAWLGHYNVLQWFLASGLETALILEDDVDWDIRLRSVQVPLAASAARSSLPPEKAFSPFAPFSRTAGSHTHYWGNTASWDLLYLGHCGDYFNEVKEQGIVRPQKGFHLDNIPHTLYHDPSLLLKKDLHPFTKDLFDALNMEDHQRAFHRSQFPLCSFGYAVTRTAARRLVNDLAAPRFLPKGPRAFDVALLHACRKGSDDTSQPEPSRRFKQYPHSSSQHKPVNAGLRCWTVNPELFHHMPGESQIAAIGQSEGEVHGLPPVDLAGETQIKERKETTNIGCGFWGGEFSFDDTDMERLRFLQEKVGRQGMCLKKGRDSL